MTTTTTIPAWVDTLQAAITATEWEWRQLDEQEWRTRDRDAQAQTALAKQAKQAEVGVLGPCFQVASPPAHHGRDRRSPGRCSTMRVACWTTQVQCQSGPGKRSIRPTTRQRCTHTHSIRIRPIRPDDGRKLQRFHSRLSDCTIYQRFHGPKPELDEIWARRFAALDGHAAAAFVATTGTRGRIVGVARYYKIGATTTAEVAFVVEDAYQGCGIGTRLMKRLREQALRNGITEFVAVMLPRNARMLRLLRAVGPTQLRAESGTVEVRVDIR